MTNELCKTLHLSPTQWDILEHRLMFGDAIAFSLRDRFEERLVETIAERLLDGDLSNALALSRPCTLAVLADACERSVYLAACRTERTHLEMGNLERAAEALGRRISRYVGRAVEVPWN